MVVVSQHQQEKWVFVITSPAHRRPNNTQRSQARRRVMREIGYARRKVGASTEDLSECMSTASGSLSDTGILTVASQSMTTHSPDCQSPCLITPFVLCPVTLDGKSQWILQHMFSETTPTQFRIYRDRWYPICSTNPAAFDQMLATYATHLSQCWPDYALEHFILLNHTKALAGVRTRLDATSASDKHAIEDILSAMTALACFSHLKGDMFSWQSHMRAVARLIEESKLSLDDLDAKVLDLIQWVDSIGSYALDINPILGSIHRGDDSAQFPAEPAVSCLSTLNLPASLLSALQSFKRVSSELLMRRTVWLSPTDIDQLIHPIVQRFLSLHYDTHFFSPLCGCVRSGALLYLAEFRRRSGIIPLITEIHLQQLISSMEALDLTSVAPELTLWLLTVGAMESTSESDRNYFYSRLNLTLQTFGIDSALLWMHYLNQVIWLDHLFDQKLNIIWSTLTG